MSVFETLPYEISTEICSYLPHASLACVSRLSHYMHTVSQPLLYKSLNLTNSQSTGTSSLENILRSLLSPGGETLATYIRSLHVQGGDDNSETATQCPKNLILFTAAASNLGLTQSLASEAGQLVLLLHLVRHLHVLTLTSLENSTDVFAQLIVTHDTSLGPRTLPLPLRNLREFKCTNGGVSPESLLTLLQLPCIRKIDVHLTDDANTPLDLIEAAAGTSPVTTLRFAPADIPPPLLERILKIPIALSYFSYTTRSCTVLPLSCVGQTLQPLRQTLLHLEIDLSGVTQPMNMPHTPAFFLPGSFWDWPALQTVTCALWTLLGRPVVSDGLRLADVLPVGIKELDIRGGGFWSFEQEVDRLVELLGVKDAAMPGLLKLAVGMGEESLRSKDMLRVACEAAGVELVDNGKGRGAGGGRRVLFTRTCCSRRRRR